MLPADSPLPSGGLTREAVARRDLGHTTVAPSTVRLMLAVFLTAIAAVPIAEVTRAGARAVGGTSTAWSHLAQLPGEVVAHVERAPAQAIQDGLLPLLRSTNRIVLPRLEGFERALEDESTIGRSLRPQMQALMTRWLGAGNERVYVGRSGWLFYRPDVEYLTARGFLDPALLARRVAAAPEWATPPAPDSRPALVQFARDLQARGITLVVVPIPVKPAVHPERLVERSARGGSTLQNPSYFKWIEDLRRDHVLVFDPSSALAAGRSTGPQYLATDTHWRPEAMELVVERLADFVAAHVSLPASADRGYRIERVERRNAGDTARMLDLPEQSTLFPLEAVWLARVLLPDGSSWRPSRDADVLVLGDSFSNIYTLESMGWGTAAGFVEHLSYTLRRPVDRIVQNDDAAFATRALLAREPDRLRGKRVVIYQFAARELAFGDWKVLPLTAPRPTTAAPRPAPRAKRGSLERPRRGSRRRRARP